MKLGVLVGPKNTYEIYGDYSDDTGFIPIDVTETMPDGATMRHSPLTSEIIYEHYGYDELTEEAIRQIEETKKWEQYEKKVDDEFYDRHRR